MVYINAGFDETSFIIKHNYPASDLKVFDFLQSRESYRTGYQKSTQGEFNLSKYEKVSIQVQYP
jgi:hypothetical protein